MEFSLEDAEQALLYLSPESREVWVQVGMALKSEFGDLAWTVFDGWSQQGSTYKPADCRAVWRSFKAGPVKVGTLIHLAREAGWKPERREFTPEEKREYARRTAAMRKAREAAEVRERLFKAQMQAVVAEAAAALLDLVSGHEPAASEYLHNKQVRVFGVFVAARSVVLVIDEQAVSFRLITGEQDIKAFFGSGAAKLDHISVRHIKRGTVIVPMNDGAGLRNVQLIFASGKKSFPRHGQKSGCFHWMGDWRVNSEVVCIAEGYATAASVYMATGFPSVVAFDAGNLSKVAAVVRQSSPGAQIIICADNDTNTDGNPGLTAAESAANDVGGVVAVPRFKDV